MGVGSEQCDPDADVGAGAGRDIAAMAYPFRYLADNLPRHLVYSVLFSLIHVSGMVALRKLAYAVAGDHYDFRSWWLIFGYEYLKDVRSYFWIMVGIGLYRLWVMRIQGEARLLAEPDVGPALESVEQPERFLVRKLGKEFLLAAREIEWLQASGNYVNLHVRGRDYPLRVTMAGIETRLDAQRFVRVHRSYVVNLDFLAEIEPLGHRRCASADARQCENSLQSTLSGRPARALRPAFYDLGRLRRARARSKLIACPLLARCS